MNQADMWTASWVNTFVATIYVSLKERDTGIVHDLAEVEAICQGWVDGIGQCVTVTPTEYIYTGGHEPGAAIGFINYPRFPRKPMELEAHALDLGQHLLMALNQYRVSIVMRDETVMLSNKALVPASEP